LGFSALLFVFRGFFSGSALTGCFLFVGEWLDGFWGRGCSGQRGLGGGRRLGFGCGIVGLGLCIRIGSCGRRANGGSCDGCAGRHGQDHLLVVAQVDGGEMGILLTPLGDVGLVALVALEEVIFTEVGQDVRTLLGHEDAGVFGVSEVDFGDLFGQVLGSGVQLGEEAAVDGHAGGAGGSGVSGIDAGDDGEGVVLLGHGSGGHSEQDAAGVDEADLGALTDEGDGLALDELDADLVWEDAHDGGALDPGDLLELMAALGKGDEEDVAADVFSEDGEHVGAGDLGEAGGVDVGGAGDAEACVALDVGLEQVGGGAEAAEDEQGREAEEDAADRAGGAPPGVLRRFAKAVSG